MPTEQLNTAAINFGVWTVTGSLFGLDIVLMMIGFAFGMLAILGMESVEPTRANIAKWTFVLMISSLLAATIPQLVAEHFVKQGGDATAIRILTAIIVSASWQWVLLNVLQPIMPRIGNSIANWIDKLFGGNGS